MFKSHDPPEQISIFLFEAITAGLQGYEALASEGVAMINALGLHLQETLNAEVRLLCSPANRSRIAPFLQSSVESVAATEIVDRFDQRCETAEAIVIIAPELNDELSRWVERAIPYEDRLWTPKRRFTQTAADKWRTAAHLRAAGVPTPETMLLEACGRLSDEDRPTGYRPHDLLSSHISFPKPWVIKPRFGAGSVGVQVIADHQSEVHWLSQMTSFGDATNFNGKASVDWLIQPLLEGDSVSVNVITGKHEARTLPACRQLLSRDGSFQYLGGAFPVEAALSDIARTTAAQAVRALPDSWGLCGVDLVCVGPQESRTPMVVDINPRVTTSVIGLCRSLTPSFATIWADAMFGRKTQQPSWRVDACQFSSQGSFVTLPSAEFVG